MTLAIWIFGAGFFGFIAGALLGESLAAALVMAASVVGIVLLGAFGG